MRLIIRPKCSYPDFVKMRDRILTHYPWGLINDTYDTDSQIAYFMFTDSDYIPPEWKHWIVFPPAHPQKKILNINTLIEEEKSS